MMKSQNCTHAKEKKSLLRIIKVLTSKADASDRELEKDLVRYIMSYARYRLIRDV